MTRAFIVVGLLAAVLIITGAVVLYLSYGLSGAPSRAYVSGLGDSTEIELFDNGSAAIQATTKEDAYAALGYLHAQNHIWSMVLWRRTSVGRLGEWFGESFLEVDRLTRRLQLGRFAHRDYGNLPGETRNLLEAYARGVNSALREDRVRLSEELVILGEEPEEWEPWHSLAIERLFAWMSVAPPHADSLRNAPFSLQSFFKFDRFLRDWLHLHGFENSMAWAASDSAGTHFFQRHVYGASALPIFQEVSLSWPGSGLLAGATLIGTPLLPAGRADDHAWAILMSSRMRLERATRDTSTAPVLYDRIHTLGGKEHLIEIEQVETGIYFEPARPLFQNVPDTSGTFTEGWVVRWSGLETDSDFAAWESLQTGSFAPFSLFEGDGLVVRRDGATRILGAPLVVSSPGRGVFVANSEWARYPSSRLDTLLGRQTVGLDPARVREDYRSIWAESLAPRLISAAIAVPDQSAPVAEALTFLRNWDFSYDRASIAASIFDTWVAAYRDSLHKMPDPHIPDSLLAENLVRYELLVKAVRSLADAYGDNLSQWRWEEVQRKRYHFPLWSADSLLTAGAGPLPKTRYAAIELPGSGNPSTLSWGPSVIQPDLPSPAEWSAWVSTSSWDAFRFHARRFPANKFFGRYLVSDRAPETATVAAAEPKHVIVLIPR